MTVVSAGIEPGAFGRPSANLMHSISSAGERPSIRRAAWPHTVRGSCAPNFMRGRVSSTSAFAALFGAFFGFSTQRRGRRGLRGLAVALLGTAVVLTAGYMRLHAPVQPEDAVTCSEARAAAHLRAFPRPENPELRDIEQGRWERDAPAACTDWGLARMSATREGPAIGFADGHGGMHWIRGVEGSSRSYTWELP